MRRLLWSLLALWLCVGSAHADETIRVRLLELYRPAAIEVAAEEAGLTVYAGDFMDTPVARLTARDVVTLSVRGGQVHLRYDEMGLNATTLTIVSDEAFGVNILDGSKDLKEPRRYTGLLRVTMDPDHPGQLKLVNHTDLETYVAGVLVREYGLNDVEGYKAMAVVIRTYALRAQAMSGTDYDVVDHVGSQVYHGIDGITEAALRATSATEGQVLMHRGRLIEAVHFASSGGHTADNETVWRGRPVPYLRGRPDPYDTVSPQHTWTSSVVRDDLLRALSQTYRFDVSGFLLGDRGPDGRVRDVELLSESSPSKTIRATTFRALMNRHFGASSLRSTLFDARREGDRYVFEGKGFGHGVGLSQ